MRHIRFNRTSIIVQIQIILCLLILPFSCLAQYVPNPQVTIPSGSTGTSRQFTDKEHDETNLNYFNSRYYDSKTGRFNQSDPVINNLHNDAYLKQKTGTDLQKILENPQNFNSYNYTNNNPIKRVDVDGEWFKEVMTGKQSFSDFNLELGQAGQDLYNSNSTARIIMNHPYTIGTIVGIGSGVLAAGASLFLGQGGLLLPITTKVIDFSTKYGKDVGEKMNQVFNGLKKITDASKFTEHSIYRITNKLGVGGETKVVDILNKVKPFEYYHEGFNKLGYYDNISKIFVGQIKDTQVITTIIVDVTTNYINNLIK